jgi:hypothetical protein
MQMVGSMIFGGVLGFLGPLAMMAAPQPAGTVIFCGGLAMYMTWGALLIWRRTGLPFVTAAVLLAAIESAIWVAAAIIGYRFPALPTSWAALFYSLIVVGIVLMIAEQRIHADEWELWRRHMEHMGARDLLTGRHIPDLASPKHLST